jgi:class 3 adenylate cyclase
MSVNGARTEVADRLPERRFEPFRTFDLVRQQRGIFDALAAATYLAGERVERRLAAVLAAAIGGYSRLMGADEERTRARLAPIAVMPNPISNLYRSKLLAH